MAVWIRSDQQLIGIADGVIRRDDFAALVEVCELNSQAAQHLAEARQRAALLVTQAEAECGAMVMAARTECDRIRADAHAQGMREAAAHWSQELVGRAIDAHQSTERASERLAELVSLATQRVLELADKDALYRRALRRVRELARESKTLVLHTGPDDVEHAREVMEGIAQELGIQVPVEVRIDQRLATGGCVLESDFGVIDASLGLQFTAVKAAITRAARAALLRPGMTMPAAVPVPVVLLEDDHER